MTFRGKPERHPAMALDRKGNPDWPVTCRVCGRGLTHVVHTDGAQCFSCPDDVFHQIGDRRQLPEAYALGCCS